MLYHFVKNFASNIIPLFFVAFCSLRPSKIWKIQPLTVQNRLKFSETMMYNGLSITWNMECYLAVSAHTALYMIKM